MCHHQTCKKLVKGVFAEHKKTRVLGEPRDFVDCYLDELDKVCWVTGGVINLLRKTESQLNHHFLQRGDDGSSFSEEQLTMYVMDLHFAGTDTTSNTLLTAFLYLTTYPHIQGR